MREIKKIILHCSDSDFGDVTLIRKWHVGERGWLDVGYHYVITNGVIAHGQPYQACNDAHIQVGRPEGVSGAHVHGHNADSIGICLIGKHHFSEAQLFRALPNIALVLLQKYNLTPLDIYGHHEFDKSKTCPNMEMSRIRDALGAELSRRRVAR